MQPLQFMQVNGETLAYRRGGKGDQTIVLIHGNMSSSAHFDLLIEALEPKYDVVAVDMRGFGGSSYQKPINDLSDFAEDIFAMLNKLNITRYQLLGWSTGGGVAMIMAAKAPQAVTKLYLMESVGIQGYPMFFKDDQGQPILDKRLEAREDIAKDPIQVAPVLEALANKDKDYYRGLWNLLIYNAGNQPEPAAYDRYLSDMLTQRNLVDVDYALNRFNISPNHNGLTEGNNLVADIKAPVVVFQGDQDLVVPQTMADSIVEALDQRATFVSLPSGHNPMIDCLDRLVDHIGES